VWQPLGTFLGSQCSKRPNYALCSQSKPIPRFVTLQKAVRHFFGFSLYNCPKQHFIERPTFWKVFTRYLKFRYSTQTIIWDGAHQTQAITSGNYRKSVWTLFQDRSNKSLVKKRKNRWTSHVTPVTERNNFNLYRQRLLIFPVITPPHTLIKMNSQIFNNQGLRQRN
jgi:hypothetical protein